MIAALIAMTGLPKWLVSLIAIVIVAAVVIGGAAYVYHRIEQSGADQRQAEIDNQNKEAGNAGEAARLSHADCVRGGMRWDFGTSKCLGHQ